MLQMMEQPEHHAKMIDASDTCSQAREVQQQQRTRVAVTDGQATRTGRAVPNSVLHCFAQRGNAEDDRLQQVV